jgi:hypothetical protein
LAAHRPAAAEARVFACGVVACQQHERARGVRGVLRPWTAAACKHARVTSTLRLQDMHCVCWAHAASPHSSPCWRGPRVLQDKDTERLRRLGGVQGLAQQLQSDTQAGLSPAAAAGPASIAEHRRVYGANELPVRPTKNFFVLCAENLRDPIILLLIAAALVRVWRVGIAACACRRSMCGCGRWGARHVMGSCQSGVGRGLHA